MNKSEKLIKLSQHIQNKYAVSLQEYMQEAIANAANWGVQVHGIMNFPEQLKTDKANMSIAINKSGNTIMVDQPILNPPEVAPNYAKLPSQIKNYLEKNLELFPKDAHSISLNLQY